MKLINKKLITLVVFFSPAASVLCDGFFSANLSLELNDRLLSAAGEGNTEEVRQLLRDENTNVNAYDSEEYTALHRAAQHGNLDIVKLLVKHNAFLDYDQRVTVSPDEKVYQTPYSPLGLAVQEGHIEIVKFLLDKGASIDYLDSTGQTALHLAVQQGHAKIVKLLLEHGASPDIEDSEDDYPMLEVPYIPILDAARKGDLEVINALIENGADLKVGDRNGDTALGHAFYQDHIEVARLLLKHDIDLFKEPVMEIDRELLHDAVDYKKIDWVRMLLRFGASVERKDVVNKSVLDRLQQNHSAPDAIQGMIHGAAGQVGALDSLQDTRDKASVIVNWLYHNKLDLVSKALLNEDVIQWVVYYLLDGKQPHYLNQFIKRLQKIGYADGLPSVYRNFQLYQSHAFNPRVANKFLRKFLDAEQEKSTFILTRDGAKRRKISSSRKDGDGYVLDQIKELYDFAGEHEMRWLQQEIKEKAFQVSRLSGKTKDSGLNETQRDWLKVPDEVKGVIGKYLGGI